MAKKKAPLTEAQIKSRICLILDIEPTLILSIAPNTAKSAYFVLFTQTRKTARTVEISDTCELISLEEILEKKF